MALAKTKTAAPTKPLLRTRFRAWWDGYEIAKSPVDRDAVAAPPTTDARPPPEMDSWAPERLHAAELIFGDGQIDPIGIDFIDEMIRPLGMNDKMSVLEFPAGIGASARAVARITGAWVQAVEPDPVLAAAAAEHSTKAGLAKKAAVGAGDLGDVGVRDQSCDVVLSFSGLQGFPDKGEVLARMDRVLKPTGEMVLTDFALTAEGAAGPEIEAWVAREATAEAPGTLEDLIARLEGLNLDVRIAEDKVEDYAGLARRALRDFLDGAEEREVSPELRAWVMREIEFWARRLAALEAGDLGFYRIHAIRA